MGWVNLRIPKQSQAENVKLGRASKEVTCDTARRPLCYLALYMQEEACDLLFYFCELARPYLDYHYQRI